MANMESVAKHFLYPAITFSNTQLIFFFNFIARAVAKKAAPAKRAAPAKKAAKKVVKKAAPKKAAKKVAKKPAAKK